MNMITNTTTDPDLPFPSRISKPAQELQNRNRISVSVWGTEYNYRVNRIQVVCIVNSMIPLYVPCTIMEEPVKKRKIRPNKSDPSKPKRRRRTEENGKDRKTVVPVPVTDPVLVPEPELESESLVVDLDDDPCTTVIDDPVVDVVPAMEQDIDGNQEHENGTAQEDNHEVVQEHEVIHLDESNGDNDAEQQDDQDQKQNKGKERVYDDVLRPPVIHIPDDPNPKPEPTTGLLDCLLGLGNSAKLYCCQDHDTGDVLGACTLVVAPDEDSARKHVDRALQQRGYRTQSGHAYTLIRLPIYRECCFFIGAIYRQKFEEQVTKESSLMLDRIKPKDVMRLNVYYGFSAAHHVRSGYVVVSETLADAKRVLNETVSATMENDWFGLYGSPEQIRDVQLRRLDMRSGVVVAATG